MSPPARGPRSGIAGKASVTNRRLRASVADAHGLGGSDMSHPARDPRSGIAGQASVTSRRHRASAVDAPWFGGGDMSHPAILEALT